MSQNIVRNVESSAAKSNDHGQGGTRGTGVEGHGEGKDMKEMSGAKGNATSAGGGGGGGGGTLRNAARLERQPPNVLRLVLPCFGPFLSSFFCLSLELCLFFEPRAASLDPVLEDEGLSGNGDEASATAILRALYVGGPRAG